MSGPRRRQTFVLHLEPKRASATVAYAFMTVLALGVVVLAIAYQDAWLPDALEAPPNLAGRPRTITIAVAAGLAVLFAIGAFVNGRRWHIARVIQRASTNPRFATILPDMEWAPSPVPAATIPRLDVRTFKSRKLPRARHLRRVTAERNVVGHPPLEIAYLRLFENQPRMRSFVQGAWREFGYVYLLRSAASVTPAEYRHGKRSGDLGSLFISSDAELLTATAGGRRRAYRKGFYRFKAVGPRTIRVHDRYGSYPMRAVLCHGAFWKRAIDLLLERVDLVVLDLSGLTGRNAGTLWELQHVVDRFRIEGVVFLIDPRTDRRFVEEVLRTVWANMAPGSPNAVAGSKEAFVAEVDVIQRRQTQTQTGGGAPGQQQMQTTQVQIRLAARRKQTRRVAQAAQRRLDQLVW